MPTVQLPDETTISLSDKLFDHLSTLKELQEENMEGSLLSLQGTPEEFEKLEAIVNETFEWEKYTCPDLYPLIELSNYLGAQWLITQLCTEINNRIKGKTAKQQNDILLDKVHPEDSDDSEQQPTKRTKT